MTETPLQFQQRLDLTKEFTGPGPQGWTIWFGWGVTAFGHLGHLWLAEQAIYFNYFQETSDAVKTPFFSTLLFSFSKFLSTHVWTKEWRS